MALTPWNRQEEWYQQMINASTGNYLPSITAQDEGKVLTVENDGSWGVENVPSELPTVGASDKDKYLHTNDSTGAVEWADAPSGMPAVTEQDAGKVATVNNSGVWVAENPSSDGVLVVNAVYDVGESKYTLDKTWQECKDAKLVSIVMDGGNTFCLGVFEFENIVTQETEYRVAVYDFRGESSVVFKSSTASGYPSYTIE